MTSYFSNIADADTLAATLPGLAAYAASVVADAPDTAGKRAAALLLASIDFDHARRYQGRKFYQDGSQDLEFPRVARERRAGYPQIGTIAARGGDEVWDWDNDADAPIVPANVMAAVVFQADSILSGNRDDRLELLQDGMIGQQIGTAQEQFAATAEPKILCRRAEMISVRYRLKTGGMQ